MLHSSARQLAAEAAAQDGALLARLRQQDTAALGELYDRYASLVYALGTRILGDPAEAESLTQDVFGQLWRRADLLDGERGLLAGWLASLTRNRALDRLRGRPDSSTAAVSPAEAGPAPGPPHESAYATALREAVTKSLALLPEPQRVALVLAYFGGLSHGEIADALTTPLATIHAQIRQAMARLRELLGEFAEANPATGAQP